MSDALQQRIQWPESEFPSASDRLDTMQRYIRSLGYFEYFWREDDTWKCMVGDMTPAPVLLSRLQSTSNPSDEAMARRLRHLKQAETPERAMLKAFLSWHSRKIAEIE